MTDLPDPRMIEVAARAAWNSRVARCSATTFAPAKDRVAWNDLPETTRVVLRGDQRAALAAVLTTDFAQGQPAGGQ